MKNKKVFAVGLVLSLVLLFGIGFFFNSKKTAKEADLAVAASVVEAYLEGEEYELRAFSVETNFNSQEKMIRVFINDPDTYTTMSTCTKEEFNNLLEYTCKMSLDAKKVASDLLNSNNINLSIRVLNDLNPSRCLLEVVNGKVEYSFRMDN